MNTITLYRVERATPDGVVYLARAAVEGGRLSVSWTDTPPVWETLDDLLAHAIAAAVGGGVAAREFGGY